MSCISRYSNYIAAIALLLFCDSGVHAANEKSEWGPIDKSADPTLRLLQDFRQARPLPGSALAPTGLTCADYLKLIASEVDFWKKHQDESGAIIDPYSHSEIQYSTPAFAHAAAALVVWGHRDDLLTPAVKALDWAVKCLSERKAASGHEDFYPTMIAHAMMLLKPRVSSGHYKQWEHEIGRFDPWKTYRMKLGSMNWNVVSSCGEELFRQMGIRQNADYVEASFAAQGRHFVSPFGLYCEGPMAYDLFPRLFLDDVLASGYRGRFHGKLETMMDRAAVTSLFMQSPWGELPAGGRSAQHQWNEAQQAAVYEMYAAKAFHDKDMVLAGAYKRAAHLALRSMLRWVRPTGEMQIVKNWMDPKERFGYERYSSHTQYNILPMSMLALACEYAESTKKVPEHPAPADLGGYVFELPKLHKIFANAGGTYVEIEGKADQHYDATGLIRIHFSGISPQLGPSDSVCAHPAYNVAGKVHPPANTGVGVAWRDAAGKWRRVGELDDKHISNTSLFVIEQSQKKVEFSVTYKGDLYGVSQIKEHYTLTPGRVILTTELKDYAGPLRYIWPVLADDGRTKSKIVVADKMVSVSLDHGKTAETFTAKDADHVSVGDELYPNHNGFARLAQAEFAKGGSVSLVIAPMSKSK